MAEVASAFVTLVPSARGFGKGVSQEIDGDIVAAGKSSGGKLAGTIKGVAGPLLAAFGAAAVGSFFKSAITGASDLVETSTKIEAIFGDASGAVQEFARGGAKALGQSKQSVLDAAATFGTFGKAAGLGGQDLAKFSTGFATLATDLASFNNTTPEQAVEAIGAALRGEAEPLRAYGVLLDDATMRQKALQLGLIETTKQALTPQQKVLAAQALIYEQTKDAQGDFLKTSSGLANQQRILSAQFTDLKATIGAALLPVVLGFVTALNDGLIPALGKVKDGAVAAFELLRIRDVLTALQGPLALVREQITVGMGEARGAFASVSEFVRANFHPTVAAVTAFVSGTLLPAFQAVAGFLVSTFRPTFDALANLVVRQLWPALQGLVARVKTNLDEFAAFGKVLAVVIVVVAAVVAKIAGFLLPILVSLAGFLAKTVFAAVGLVIGILGSLAQAVTIVVTTFGKMLSAVGQVLSGLVGLVKGVVNVIVGVFTGDLGRIKDGARQAAGGVMDIIQGLPRLILAALSGLGTLLVGVGGDLMRGLAKGIQGAVKAVVDAAVGAAKAVVNGVKSALGINSPSKVFATIGDQIGDGLIVGMDRSESAVRRSAKALVGATVAPGVGSGAAVVGSGGLVNNSGVVEELREVRATLARMPRDYQLGARAGVGLG